MIFEVTRPDKQITELDQDEAHRIISKMVQDLVALGCDGVDVVIRVSVGDQRYSFKLRPAH